MTGGTLLASYVFGSVGRGQADHLSDLDILAVVENAKGKVPENVVLATVPATLRRMKSSISWYGENRLREMFANGELFAWHLHRETRPLFDTQGFLAKLGTPSPYRDTERDVASFIKVMREIPAQIALNQGNAIYEAGLIYVCLRNIAMSASWDLCDAPDFSRYSIFNLGGVPRCPLSQVEFEQAMFCRMAGQRGAPPPDGVDAAFVIDVHSRVWPWLEALSERLSGEGTSG
ncbi:MULTISPECIES: nucleotidyltransferase domain-containing protein [unclassified Rhizobium]|uniref:nucleotidyltransferase domain-containing protein n=1 Tax=unclassified Rhizobium TaxID=2613769 RepID=UPI0007EB43D4|nr:MULTISPECIES: nucleotidyltransferase domain-containing protein [unclassified Rhizobium]ANM14026.1 hypothetical protein AMK05_PD00125 [Rhizobium sp. N324]ANM20406.1 hypothetical protein AMK06_PD00127 [Rhizobium sp. N541]ANM26790.1 hypothetical protein AMK07_PD00127 [Rhizobium sp. N941]OYD00195.1 hypothetical protein AMK08_PD00125 [Rhizobium sp. N4311]